MDHRQVLADYSEDVWCSSQTYTRTEFASTRGEDKLDGPIFLFAPEGEDGGDRWILERETLSRNLKLFDELFIPADE